MPTCPCVVHNWEIYNVLYLVQKFYNYKGVKPKKKNINTIDQMDKDGNLVVLFCHSMNMVVQLCLENAR